MPDRFASIAPGVLVATAVPYVTTTTVVTGTDGGCLVIDPAVTVREVAGLAASLASRGLRPTAGWSTHPHWDHLLWHGALGDAVRYATPGAVVAERRWHDDNLSELAAEAPGHDPALFGQLTTLATDTIPWDGPVVRVIAHDGHAPGHGALFLPEAGVLIAGDMCSDIEMPLLDLDVAAADPLGDYRTGLGRLAALADLRWVVPGHGHVGDAAEFRRRVSLDLTYLDSLQQGTPSDDPRITSDWLRTTHEAQQRRFGRR